MNTLLKDQLYKFFFVLALSSIIAGCSKSDDSSSNSTACDDLSSEINTKEAAYNASNTAANCQAVITAYNNYINASDCLTASEKESYKNERDAFKTAHCP